ncbi:MAG TPA: hypothetical protein ENI97_11435 [Gammaproteobacteria bacterium]|nr:hypothetical protein [Gammaproteobacteria bacterium]
MQYMRILVLGMVLFGLLGGTAVYAAGKSATYQMAEIMHRLKHYPSPVGKETLHRIAQSDSASKNERTIATAMINLEHRVAAGDIQKLKAIINDPNATPHERELASIVLNLDHRPTAADKAKLKAMMQ